MSVMLWLGIVMWCATFEITLHRKHLVCCGECSWKLIGLIQGCQTPTMLTRKHQISRMNRALSEEETAEFSKAQMLNDVWNALWSCSKPSDLLYVIYGIKVVFVESTKRPLCHARHIFKLQSMQKLMEWNWCFYSLCEKHISHPCLLYLSWLIL